MLAIFGNILVIFSLIGVGFAASKANILPYPSSQYLVKLMLIITTPCLILYSMTEQTLDADMLQSVKQVVVGICAYYILGSLAACLIVRLMKIEPKDDAGVYRCLLVFTNSGFMGFPIAKAVFGADGLFLMVIGNTCFTFFLYSLGIFLLHLGGDSKMTFRSLARAMCNTCMLAAVAGIVMLCFQLRFPPLIVDFLTMVGDMTIPLSMLIIGIQLASSKLKSILVNKQLLLMAGFNLLLCPSLVFLLLLPLHFAPLVKCTLVLTAALPAAAAIPAIAQNEGKNARIGAEGVALTTLFSLVTIPITATLLLTYFN